MVKITYVLIIATVLSACAGVELVNTGVGLLLSADIFEDGRVELFQWSMAAGSLYTGDERKGFGLCLEKYKIVQY